MSVYSVPLSSSLPVSPPRLFLRVRNVVDISGSSILNDTVVLLSIYGVSSFFSPAIFIFTYVLCTFQYQYYIDCHLFAYETQTIYT